MYFYKSTLTCFDLAQSKRRWQAAHFRVANCLGAFTLSENICPQWEPCKANQIPSRMQVKEPATEDGSYALGAGGRRSS